MWIIRIMDSHTRRVQIVREDFYEGAVIYFEHEEDAVRLAVWLTRSTMACFGVACVAQRFCDDPRKERMKRIGAAQLPRICESLLVSMGVEPGAYE